MNSILVSKLGNSRILERIFRERLSEPLHLNVISALAALFGSTKLKIYFNLLVRQEYAYGLLAAAERAIALGDKRLTAIEFGVANGEGLMNLCELAASITRELRIEFDIVGFDSGAGMPQALDYRDHPEYYKPGWFPMQDQEKLRSALPPNADLIIGPISSTIANFVPKSPIGFISIDVDYYSSAIDCFKLLDTSAENFQPTVDIYLDDIHYLGHNEWCGEMLAVQEFNNAHTLRKIGRTNFLREHRLFQRAVWISHFYTLHVLDHSTRRPAFSEGRQPEVLGNAYLNL